jgi:aryl-alcohol dehydrogenase-like predicted oxidoreductase
MHTPISTRRLGRTGLQVSALALGTVELGLDYGIAAPGHFGRPAEGDAIRLVHAALDAGINLIDTARAYGSSEAVLGKALAGRRQDVILASKVSTQGPGATALPPADLRRQMLASLDTSLQTLSTNYLDIWQVHNVDRPTLAAVETLAEVFDHARRSGKIRWSGGSFYGDALPLAALQAGLFDVMQVTYSVLDQRLADAFFPAAAAQDVGVLVRSVLLKGALTDRADHLPSNLETLRAHSRAFRGLVAESGLPTTPAQTAIAFALAQPAIHSVLIGVRTVQELADNLPALSLHLPEPYLRQLAALRLDDPDLLNPATWGIP